VEPLQPDTLHHAGGVLHCRLRDGEVARLGRQAALTLAEHLEEEAGQVVLRLGPTTWPVADAPP
jgi:hypothetical protein